MITVHIWPDGEFCYEEELQEMLNSRTDDYITKETDVCEVCKSVFELYYDEPFASCDCGTREWYH